MNIVVWFTSVLVIWCIPVILFAADIIDTDGDGLSDSWEAYYYTDPLNPDTDGDGYTDGGEVSLGYSPHKANAWMHQHDYDGDGLNDWAERLFMTDVGKSDTDGDGYSDLDEVMFGYSPKQEGPTIRYDREIRVDKTKQRLYYYVDGKQVFEFPVSTGNPGTETPSGTFDIQRKVDV